ncbi:MAG: threonine ammonia-lyase [Bryobacteraceae bacterium]
MISLADIKTARERIRDSVYLSPAPQSETLSRATGNALCLKLENLQMTGSFKERGALNRILTLTPEERAHGVITASAGNHGQAVAYHASKRGIRAQICMPVYTPITKLNAVRDYGGEVLLVGNNYDEAMQDARRREAAEHRTYLSAFDDDAVIAGQGTIGLELLEQIPDLEAVVVPVGGGGLIAGIACAVKESKPGIHVIGVQTTALPSMQVAMREHKPVLLPPGLTVADGIAVRKVGEKTLALCEKYVDEILTVDDEEIAMAVLWLLEKEKTLAEGAGAAGMAAMLNHKTSLRGRKVAVVLSGGNLDVTTLSRIIERGLVKDGRLVRLRITLSDHPGGLQALATVIAEQRANIVQVTHDRAYFGVHLGETSVDITMETRGPEHIAELLGKLTAAGYRFDRVT